MNSEFWILLRLVRGAICETAFFRFREAFSIVENSETVWERRVVFYRTCRKGITKI